MKDLIAKRLQERREKRGLEQSQVAQYEELKQPMLSKWEAGAIPDALETLAKLAKRYQTSADYFLLLTDEPTTIRDSSTHYIDPTIKELLDLIQSLDADQRRRFVDAAKLILGVPRIIE